MRVFLSYRRSDTQDLAGRIADRLRQTQGIERVFLDVEGVKGGEDFRAKIDGALADCDVCLLLIGSGWRGTGSDGRARISDEDDVVRFELRRALERGIRILPVLANNEPMPANADLPEDVRRVTDINALRVRHLDFERDMSDLVNAIFGRESAAPVLWLTRERLLREGLRTAAGGASALALLLVAAILHQALTGGRSLDQTFGRGGVALLIAVALLAGFLAPHFAGRLLRRRPRS